ncbi:unnamed protein product [Caenorhabditis bovis]|uniref:[histone H3]-lysine(27) N-trimethyltransferase n=1 Tax=Caenorhabditis bovis TaxID=2654633 RepID=A0A8S1ERJ8_9PELO|nr:unnamed protein product [Caenorhabditis bovis]
MANTRSKMATQANEAAQSVPSPVRHIRPSRMVKAPRAKNEQNSNKDTMEIVENCLHDKRETIVENDLYPIELIRDISLEIRRNYIDVSKQLNESIKEELQSDVTALINQKPEFFKGPPRPPFTIYRKKGRQSDSDHYVTPVCLPSTDGFPVMSYWVHVESNIRGEESLRLTHMPYLDEDQNDDDICESIFKLFEEGIHGYSENWRYMNDWLLYEVFNRVFQKYQKDRRDEFLFAFYQLFPNKYSKSQLPFAYEELIEKWRTGVKKVITEGLQLNKFSYPPLAALDPNSIEEMNCLQCITFDCPAHGFNPLAPERFQSGAWIRAILPLPSSNSKNAAKCGDKCYKTLERKKVFEILGIGDKPGEKLDVHFEKHELVRCSEERGSTFITTFSYTGETAVDFCEFVKAFNSGEKLYTCLQAYELVLGFCRFPSEQRLFADKPKIKVPATQMQRMFRHQTWSNGIGKIENVHRLIPCDHEGPCDKRNVKCTCRRNKVCTKFCGCEDTCRMKFPGCRCAPGQCRTKQCQCFFAKWECDPAICKTCRCDSVNINDKSVCRNMSITRGAQKKIKVMTSQVAGWGAFIMENAEKGDFISEYTGELVSSQECERRGNIYDKFKTSYIFALNREQGIDANNMGNMIRFANHSDKDSNCYAKIILVNGEHRIGIFARKDLKYGDELLFDYSYNMKQKMMYVSNDRFGKKMKSNGKRSAKKENESDEGSDEENDEDEEEEEEEEEEELEEDELEDEEEEEDDEEEKDVDKTTKTLSGELDSVVEFQSKSVEISVKGTAKRRKIEETKSRRARN